MAPPSERSYKITLRLIDDGVYDDDPHKLRAFYWTEPHLICIQCRQIIAIESSEIVINQSIN